MKNQDLNIINYLYVTVTIEKRQFSLEMKTAVAVLVGDEGASCNQNCTCFLIQCCIILKNFIKICKFLLNSLPST